MRPIVFNYAVLIVCVGSFQVAAQPFVTMDYLGQNAEGYPRWRVDVNPDTSLFTNGEGTLAAEIAFSITGSKFLDATVNESVWAFENLGLNPFTDSMTAGLSFDPVNVFASFASDPVSGPVELLTFTTVGVTGVLSFGGYAIDSGQSGGFVGSRLIQAGQNFDTAIGSASFVIQSPVDCNIDGVVDAADLLCACGKDVLDAVLSLTEFIPGDLDADGGVGFADFLVMSANFGRADVGYADGDLDCDGTVAFADFLVLSTNFGTSSAAIATVPEPSSVILFAPLFVACWLSSRSSRKD